jgi:MFS family permease
MDSVDRSEQENAEIVLSKKSGEEAPHDPYEALRFPDFRLLAIARFIATLGEQMVSFAIGWHLYDLTHSTLALGLVGLVQVAPIVLLSLPAGHIADRYERRRVILIFQLLLSASSLGLAVLSYTHGTLVLIYGCLLLIGIGRAFTNPAAAALVSQTVPVSSFSNAATWNSTSWQLAAVMGPALGGVIVAWRQSATLVYALNVCAGLIAFGMILMIRSRQAKRARETTSFKSLAAGVGFVWRTKIILAAITLDMFAVLLGGATALLPAFAKDILLVDAGGLGLLRAAPSAGAVLMAFLIAHLPPFKHAGRALLLAVSGFGVATIIFGLSTSFVLSLLMLFLLGAFDNISVVIRGTLLLVRTPDEMRGRISAVNSVFLGASNELGEFESGTAADLLGRVFGPLAGTALAVVGGGIGTLIVVAAVAIIWPELRLMGSLNETVPIDGEEDQGAEAVPSAAS